MPGMDDNLSPPRNFDRFVLACRDCGEMSTVELQHGRGAVTSVQVLRFWHCGCGSRVIDMRADRSNHLYWPA